MQSTGISVSKMEPAETVSVFLIFSTLDASSLGTRKMFCGALFYPMHTGGCSKAWHTDSGTAVPPVVSTVRHVHPVHRHSLDCRVKRAGNRPCTPCNARARARVCMCVWGVGGCVRACFCLRVHRTDSHIRLTYPDA